MSDQDSNAKDPNETSAKGRKKRRRRKRRDRSSNEESSAKTTAAKSTETSKDEAPKADDSPKEETKTTDSSNETEIDPNLAKASSVDLKALLSTDALGAKDDDAMSGLDALGLPEPKSIFDDAEDDDEDNADSSDASPKDDVKEPKTSDKNDAKAETSKTDEAADDQDDANTEAKDDVKADSKNNEEKAEDKGDAKAAAKPAAKTKRSKTTKANDDAKAKAKDGDSDDGGNNGDNGDNNDDGGGSGDPKEHNLLDVETVYIDKEQKASGVLAVFEHPDDILHAAEEARDEGFQVWDVYTPFPVHGMDDAMGIGRSWMPWVTFCLALTGMTTALTIQFGTMYFDWPIIIGGKPFFSWPSFMPITFELSVLFAGIGSVLVMFAANGLPNFRSRHVHPRITRDRFVLWISSSDEKFQRDRTISFLQKLHPMEIQEVKDK